MRILLINYEYPPVGGGAATATQAIAKALVDLGHRVVVLTGRFKRLPKSSEVDDILIHRIPSLRRAMDRAGIFEMASFLMGGLIFTPALIRKHHIEGVIVFFSLPCGPIGLLGRWMCRVPYIVALRGGDVPGNEPSLNFFHQIFAPLRRAVLKNGLAIVANSEGLRKIAETADPFPVRVIPNGVDSDFFIPAQTKPARRDGDAFRILFVGRFQEQKNLPLFFRQAARLSPGTFELQLVGDGPEKQRLKRLAEEIGIAATITWHGWLARAAVREAYQTADCLVNPSLYEGMPNVVLEAMACGLPVIASNVPGNDTLVLHGETGLLFELNDPTALAAALVKLQDGDLRLRMGRSARRRALEFFPWEAVALRYMELFPLERRLAI
jgi:glycosyltransferase involved in cell wall biosynthesis